VGRTPVWELAVTEISEVATPARQREVGKKIGVEIRQFINFSWRGRWKGRKRSHSALEKNDHKRAVGRGKHGGLLYNIFAYAQGKEDVIPFSQMRAGEKEILCAAPTE